MLSQVYQTDLVTNMLEFTAAEKSCLIQSHSTIKTSHIQRLIEVSR